MQRRLGIDVANRSLKRKRCANPGPGGIIEIEGDVSSLSGGCPALTFRLGSQVVRTTSSTSFEHIKCSEVKNGIELEVYGRMQVDRSLTATGVQPEYY